MNKTKSIFIVGAIIVFNLCLIFLPNLHLLDRRIMKVIQISILILVYLIFFARIFYIERNKKPINYRGAFFLLLSCFTTILIGRLIYNWIV